MCLVIGPWVRSFITKKLITDRADFAAPMCNRASTGCHPERSPREQGSSLPEARSAEALEALHSFAQGWSRPSGLHDRTPQSLSSRAEPDGARRSGRLRAKSRDLAFAFPDD